MTYDYIIVGAGSAGCVLAKRLSEDAGTTVLLVEAGGRDLKPEIHIPGGYVKLHKSKVDWGYWSEPQEHLLNRKIYLPRGKTMGGCSSTNAMAYVRGNKEDYNDWAASGAEGWSYNEVLPYFKKSETHQQIKDAYHGTSGELNVTIPDTFESPFKEAFLEACASCGIPKNMDYNGVSQSGASPTHCNIKDGKRHSMASAFIKPILKRKNLTILRNTHVRKILIQNDEATGIEIQTKKKQPQHINANKEVILSAGTFGSPHILMLSGIGSKDELDMHKIECKLDLPGVGKNLQDHLFYPISALSKTQEGVNHHTSMVGQGKGILRWTLKKDGPFSVSPLEAIAFSSTSMSPDRVDFQFHYCSLQLGNGHEYDFYDMSTFPKMDGFSILPTLLRPKSHGHLRLLSADPLQYPEIQPNFLEAEEDRLVLLEAGRKALEVIQSKPFEPYRKSIVAPTEFSSDEALFLHIQKSVETVYHPIGTCKMGEDDMSVVDNQLRLQGIDNLRVIDGSVMPTIVSGNTHAPIVMIGEKGADMILHG